ncbi:MAG: hypothetical protein AMXMBFR83_12910 [Phycisphaerae bacterium]
MSLMRLPFRFNGKCVTAVTLAAFLRLTIGCGDLNLVLPDGGSGDSFGVIVNTDVTKDLIGGVRLRSGEAVYAFGTFNPDGTVGEVTACVYQNADGQQAELFFESGRVSRCVGFDGSEIVITYTEVTSTRLKGSATYTPAGGTPATLEFDIDLQQTAAQIAQLVRDLTGIQISTDEPPEPTAGSLGEKALAGAPAAKTTLFVFLLPGFISFTGFVITLTLSQLMNVFIQAGNTLVLVFLTPFILMGNLMRAATGQPLVTIEYDQGNPVLIIPRPRYYN